VVLIFQGQANQFQDLQDSSCQSIEIEEQPDSQTIHQEFTAQPEKS
jgi:hypothetical protein